MPPANSHPKAAGVKPFHNLGSAIMHVQPIPIYNIEENHFGQVIQKALIIIPINAQLQIMAKTTIPNVCFITSRQYGVYVPAINTQIIM